MGRGRVGTQIVIPNYPLKPLISQTLAIPHSATSVIPAFSLYINIKKSLYQAQINNMNLY